MSTWLLPIESARLRLIPATAEHADAFADAALESHTELSQWSRRGGGDDRASYLKTALARVEPTANGTFVRRYAFTREEPARLIGSVTIQAWRRPIPGVAEGPPNVRVDRAPDLELGYWCRTSLMGQGYASEAVSALVEHAFDDLGAQTLWLRIGAENTRSRRLAERLLFEEVERVAFPASAEWGDPATVLFMRRERATAQT